MISIIIVVAEVVADLMQIGNIFISSLCWS